jgi:hypothetical protein
MTDVGIDRRGAAPTRERRDATRLSEEATVT